MILGSRLWKVSNSQYNVIFTPSYLREVDIPLNFVNHSFFCWYLRLYLRIMAIRIVDQCRASLKEYQTLIPIWQFLTQLKCLSLVCSTGVNVNARLPTLLRMRVCTFQSRLGLNSAAFSTNQDMTGNRLS